jgi:hypothetical protein
MGLKKSFVMCRIKVLAGLTFHTRPSGFTELDYRQTGSIVFIDAFITNSPKTGV